MRIEISRDATMALSLLPASQKPIGSAVSKDSFSLRGDLPGGSPFSLCDVSRPTDLFNIRSIELTRQPVHIDDEFTIHMYGAFLESFTPNASLDLQVNCGSHCEEYGAPPGQSPGESATADFCELSGIEQPLGGKKATCPPQEGYALITSSGYVFPMFFGTPGWYNFTFDAKTAEGDRIYCLTAEDIGMIVDGQDKEGG
ncbi:hypothetical protein E0Z10_g9 [Xylaria hypoxylon]|uniref:MD-2-related lipid-recognition domain-containing protein n=1 Tax=Xylaria hypoxylon TaxID=37992 RepID=A0A4Z0ZI83_9PEZI|nr:hypothetical protein E0Z10_g9 [Xylaria hypoxylon]